MGMSRLRRAHLHQAGLRPSIMGDKDLPEISSPSPSPNPAHLSPPPSFLTQHCMGAGPGTQASWP